MGQFVETINGISQACLYLDFPVVSGNVSFYNETQNKSISPTPTIGGVGLIKDLNSIMSFKLKETDSFVIVVGKTIGHLHQSDFFREIMKINDGPPPEINLFNEKNNGLIIQKLISKKLLNSVHDISTGGIIVALSEMSIAGKIGVKIKIPKRNNNLHEYLFGEDQSRYLIEVNKKNKDEVCKIMEKNSIYYEVIGTTQKDNFDLDKEFSLKLSDLSRFNTIWFKNYFNES